MTTDRETFRPMPMVRPFPRPGPSILLAHREIYAANSSTERLPRPWIPATCTRPPLRAELWKWLDEVVVWLNHEHCFDTADLLPTCWPRHPHLVHELAVLADLRLRAETSATSDHLEEWHRYTLPAFRDRALRQLAQHCDSGHPTPDPHRPRVNRYLNDADARARATRFAADVAAIDQSVAVSESAGSRSTLRVVDTQTGELTD